MLEPIQPVSDVYDYARFAILYVNDDPALRKYFNRLFGQRYRVLDAESGTQALAILEGQADGIGVILTRTPGNDVPSAMVLGEMADLYPGIVKILSCRYSDHDEIIGAVDHSGLFWRVTEPWDVPGLEVTLRRALEFYMVRRERDELLDARRQAVC